ncbi:hypothetical protein [Acinetobacter sp. ANC 4173]|uniref:hypothetical protein n=1 Tax=Acinetobacter sp. ANC 4173 TaxID=2529837 RepID=UPI00103D3DBC|nr:hypothetical protein [Acinetobacter sp. ANC 4173]TCB82314.1 hypothetical protein E0H94_01575 [Acinetobacter sp. ANC 4173]
MAGIKPDGKGVTKPNKPITEVKVDNYYVVIMIDASHPEKALIKTQDGSTAHNPIAEPGHALHYIVKNGIIQSVLSFGPSSAAAAAIGPATADCTMKNMVYAFKYNLTKVKAEKLIEETNSWRNLITNGSIFSKEGRIVYSGITNDTCAETMLQVLRPYIPELPKGKGKTGTYSVYIRAVTPYWLFDDLKKAGTPYKIYRIGEKYYTKEDLKKLIDPYLPKKNQRDAVIW